QLELGRLYHWQIGRLLALENPTRIDTELAVRIGQAGAVAHQASRCHDVARAIARGQRVARRHCSQLIAPGGEDRPGGAEQRVGPLRDEARERRVDVAFAACVLDVEMQAKYARSCLHVARFGLRSWIGWVDQDADRSGRWDEFVEQLQPFLCEFVD